MLVPALVLSSMLAAQTANPKGEGGHLANGVFRSLVDGGLDLEGRQISLPLPTLRDGQPSQEQREALRRVAGSDRAVDELLRDSVAAPHILKLRDETAGPTIVRHGDLWFAFRSDLDSIDPQEAARRAEGAEPVEAGNMRFESRLLDAEQLGAHGLKPSSDRGPARTWYVHLSGRLLDRIQVETTNRVEATRGPDSWVIASRTEHRFDADPRNPNQWWPIARRGGRDEPGPHQPFAGGASYVKISRLADPPGVLVAELHYVYAEPKSWFNGAPILRSKIGLIAQDQVRRLRRDLARRRGEKTP